MQRRTSVYSIWIQTPTAHKHGCMLLAAAAAASNSTAVPLFQAPYLWCAAAVTGTVAVQSAVLSLLCLLACCFRHSDNCMVCSCVTHMAWLQNSNAVPIVHIALQHCPTCMLQLVSHALCCHHNAMAACADLVVYMAAVVNGALEAQWVDCATAQ